MSNYWGPSLHRGPYAGDTDKGCWLWTGDTVGKLVYGKATTGGKCVRVHRAVFEAVYGYAPPVVRHRCDTPLCYRPDHLLPGTSKDNADDMVARERQSRGTARHNAHLTPEAAQRIRMAHARLLDALAEEHGVARVTIQAVIARRNWAHLG